MECFTDENFMEKVKDSKGIVIVDFYAEWCAPCKSMFCLLEKIDRKYPQIKTGVLDSKENSQAVREYEIMSLPTLIFFQNGVEVKRMMGVPEKEAVEEVLEHMI